MDDQIARLIRVEEKIDRVSEAIISIARMEEKMITLFKRMDTYDEAQKNLEKRLGGVELKIASGAWIEKLAFLVIGAVIAYLFK